MSQLFERAFRCGDGEALVTYVYGESSPAERDAIDTHLVLCAACAEEVTAIGSTRQQLASWAPPFHALGFQITRADAAVLAESAPPDATVLRPAAWWKQPLPAWAQMAAAVVIFASGMAIGMGRGATAPATTAGVPGSGARAVNAASTPAASPAVSPQELAQVEQRLAGQIAQLRAASTPAPAASSVERVLLQRVNRLIAESEARQTQELDYRTSVLASDVSNARLNDLRNIEKRFGATTAKVINNQQDINSLAQRVGYSPAFSPYVP